MYKNKEKRRQHKRLWYRKPYGFLSSKYDHQYFRSKKNNWGEPVYKKQEFLDRWINNPMFIELFNNWKKNNYLKKLSPSFDRINNNKGYSFDNIQLVTWEKNEKNYINDKKYFSATGVIQYDLKNNEINRFNSMVEAGRKLNISWKAIQKCCHGGRKSTHGFKFTFSEKKKYKDKRIYFLTTERKKIYD